MCAFPAEKADTATNRDPQRLSFALTFRIFTDFRIRLSTYPPAYLARILERLVVVTE